MGKIVFFDIDGTLVDNATQVIPDSTVKALAQLRQAGHLAVLNTGRPYTHLDPRILAMDFDGCVSACGMQVQAGGRRLHWTGATQAQCRRMVELCRAWDMDTMFETPTGAVHMGPLGQEAETELARIAQRGLTVAQTEQYVQDMLSDRVPGTRRRRPPDIREFLNDLTQSLALIQSAGVAAVSRQQETDREITLTITIPKCAG